MAINRFDLTQPPGPRMSRCVVRGDTVYLAGLTAGDASQDIKGQTKQILDSMGIRIKWWNVVSALPPNKSLDASGGSVFLNLLGVAEGALIRAGASTQPLGGSCEGL